MQLILLESRGQWAVSLRRELGNSLLRIRETRSIAECEAELVAAPASFVVVELMAPSAESLLERITVWTRRFPAAAVAVVAGRQLVVWDEIVREAGVVFALFSPRRAGSLATAIKRHATLTSQPPGSVADRIWAELPLA